MRGRRNVAAAAHPEDIQKPCGAISRSVRCYAVRRRSHARLGDAFVVCNRNAIVGEPSKLNGDLIERRGEFLDFEDVIIW